MTATTEPIDFEWFAYVVGVVADGASLTEEEVSLFVADAQKLRADNVDLRRQVRRLRILAEQADAERDAALDTLAALQQEPR